MIKKLLLDEYPLIVLPSLAKVAGINGAIVLQQLHYWLLKSNNIEEGFRWRYRTYEGWAEDLPWLTASGIRKVLKKLEKDGLIITANHNKRAADKTKWYRLNYDHTLLLAEHCPKRSDHVPQKDSVSAPECTTLPETTAENTTETNNKEKSQKKDLPLTANKSTIPPLPGWVSEYAESIGFTLDGDKFCDFYGQKDWLVGKAKMKDWQCAVRTWKHRHDEQHPPAPEWIDHDPDDRILDETLASPELRAACHIPPDMTKAEYKAQEAEHFRKAGITQ